MKITIQECEAGEEDEVIIRCKTMDEQLLQFIAALRMGRDKVTVFREDKLYQVLPGDIYYFEAVDNRVFAYMEKEVYETRSKLYELEGNYRNGDFFRASKSTIINLAKIENIGAAFNGCLEACMKNGERLIISRQYAPVLKDKLGL